MPVRRKLSYFNRDVWWDHGDENYISSGHRGCDILDVDPAARRLQTGYNAPTDFYPTPILVADPNDALIDPTPRSRDPNSEQPGRPNQSTPPAFQIWNCVPADRKFAFRDNLLRGLTFTRWPTDVPPSPSGTEYSLYTNATEVVAGQNFFVNLTQPIPNAIPGRVRRPIRFTLREPAIVNRFRAFFSNVVFNNPWNGFVPNEMRVSDMSIKLYDDAGVYLGQMDTAFIPDYRVCTSNRGYIDLRIAYNIDNVKFVEIHFGTYNHGMCELELYPLPAPPPVVPPIDFVYSPSDYEWTAKFATFAYPQVDPPVGPNIPNNPMTGAQSIRTENANFILPSESPWTTSGTPKHTLVTSVLTDMSWGTRYTRSNINNAWLFTLPKNYIIYNIWLLGRTRQPIDGSGRIQFKPVMRLFDENKQLIYSLGVTYDFTSNAPEYTPKPPEPWEMYAGIKFAHKQQPDIIPVAYDVRYMTIDSIEEGMGLVSQILINVNSINSN